MSIFLSYFGIFYKKFVKKRNITNEMINDNKNPNGVISPQNNSQIISPHHLLINTCSNTQYDKNKISQLNDSYTISNSPVHLSINQSNNTGLTLKQQHLTPIAAKIDKNHVTNGDSLNKTHQETNKKISEEHLGKEN